MDVRRTALILGSSLALAAAIAPQASACREYSPTEEQLAELPVVVHVTVLRAKRVEDPDWQTWKITAEGRREPDAPVTKFEFYATLASSSCPRLALPQPGDPWVLRLTNSTSEAYDDAYPEGYLEDLKARADKWAAEDDVVTTAAPTPPPDASDTANPPPAPHPSDQ